jgi:predicted phage tail protein
MTEQNPAIYGSGGGGQQQTVVAAQQQPTVKKDNLQSKAYARILDLISEGEIGGLVDGDKSIYLDNTPLRAADGSLNFLNVKTDTRLGTNDQEYISGFTSTESEKGVNVTVVANNA